MNDFENMKSKVKQFTVDRDWDQLIFIRDFHGHLIRH
jgi:hypothetical protein